MRPDGEAAKADPDGDGWFSEASTETGSDTASPRRPQECADVPEQPALALQGGLTIFDWDDTLLPTTWLREWGLMEDSAVIDGELDKQLEALAGVVATTLEVARKHGGVAIVTNAEQGWVELSCRTFLPSLQAHLEGMRIVSARALYQQQEGYAPTEWKTLAFQDVAGEFYGTLEGAAPRPRNIVSLGDAIYELEAVKRVAAGAGCRAKSVKFVGRPCLAQLREQHELIAGVLGTIIDFDGSLDLEVGEHGIP